MLYSTRNLVGLAKISQDMEISVDDNQISSPISSSDAQENGFETNELQSLDYFRNIEVENKADLSQMVQQFHLDCHRKFRTIRSDNRRLAFACVVGDCPFRLVFNFRHNVFKAPSISVQHTCQQTATIISIAEICNRPYVRLWMRQVKRNASTKGLQDLLVDHGLHLTGKQKRRVLDLLQEQMFGNDANQFKLLPSYVQKLNTSGQFAMLESNENKFYRLCVVYREGIQAFSSFYQRGLQLDATFLKSTTQGTLMVACFKDSNNNIRIIGIAIVPWENEEHWKWFLNHLKSRITTPSFIISDRDKGLLQAVNLFEGVHHAFCFRHVMENFNLRFKDKALKKKAWGVAKAKTLLDLKKAETKFSGREDCLIWLQNIGYEKLTLVFSPVCRYGTVTSNNVESLNNRLRHLRALPIIELLLGMEEMIVSDRFASSEMALSWTTNFTHYGQQLLNKHLKASEDFTILRHANNQYIAVPVFPQKDSK
jgi:hypothetical protein